MSGLGLQCLSSLLWQAATVRNFSTFAILKYSELQKYRTMHNEIFYSFSVFGDRK